MSNNTIYPSILNSDKNTLFNTDKTFYPKIDINDYKKISAFHQK